MDAKRKLKGMLARIFSDASAEAAEKEELLAYLSSGALRVSEVQEVFEDFIQTTWKITMADGVVSDIEKKRLREIAKVLGVTEETLPPQWAKLLRDAP